MPIIIKMQPIFDIIKQVLTSWQVIAVTLAILIYISIVNHASRSYHRPREKKKLKLNFKKKKEAPAAAPIGDPEDDLPGGDSNDELGLEEA